MELVDLVAILVLAVSIRTKLENYFLKKRVESLERDVERLIIKCL